MTEGKGNQRSSGFWTVLKQTLVLILNDELALRVSILSMKPVEFSVSRSSPGEMGRVDNGFSG
jgi:hypothetical protein